jgi:hypothetical protein
MSNYWVEPVKDFLKGVAAWLIFAVGGALLVHLIVWLAE